MSYKISGKIRKKIKKIKTYYKEYDSLKIKIYYRLDIKKIESIQLDFL